MSILVVNPNSLTIEQELLARAERITISPMGEEIMNSITLRPALSSTKIINHILGNEGLYLGSDEVIAIFVEIISECRENNENATEWFDLTDYAVIELKKLLDMTETQLPVERDFDFFNNLDYSADFELFA